jgi:membrane protein YqaA with SNARE-associated domain
MIMQMLGLVIGVCAGYLLGLFVYEQMQPHSREAS